VPEPRVRRRHRANGIVLLLLGLLALVGCDASILPRPLITVDPNATPTPGPPTPTPLPTVPPTSAPQAYRVRPGDTLSRIASRFKRTLGQILAANATITDPNHIEIGQLITIPAANAPDIPPSIGSVVDPSDDLVDPTGAATDGPGYADLLGVALRLRDQDLLMELQLLTSPPDVDGTVEPIVYTINIDTTGDGEPDDAVTYQNNVPGQTGWVATLLDRVSGTQLSGPSFPGTVKVTQTAVDLVVSLESLGVPSGHGQIDAAATVQRTFLPDGPADTEPEQSIDRAPDQQWPGPNARWVTVGR
jgi:LysM repeat protein